MGNTKKTPLTNDKTEELALSKNHGKKIKYRLRQVQEAEAEYEIEDYIGHGFPENGTPDVESETE